MTKIAFLSLCAIALLSACGVKPDRLGAPSSYEDKEHPAQYPAQNY